MIPALFALAAAMIVAGAAAVIEGFPYVRLESGMAMVQGGAVLGSAGLLMVGLAVVATTLKRIERAVQKDAPAGTVSAAPEVHDPFADALLAQVAVPAAATERPRIEPSVPGPTEAPHAAQPELPLPGLTAPPVMPPKDEREPEPVPAYPAKVEPAEEDLFVPSRPTPVPPYVPPSPSLSSSYGTTIEATPAPAPLLRPGLDADDGERPVPAAPSSNTAANEESASADRTVVGRYSSGGNTYLMFSDGAIEADTPNGRFTFASLDELKAFVDGGGESGTRGAA